MLRRIFSKIIGRFFESILAASMMASLSFLSGFSDKNFSKKGLSESGNSRKMASTCPTKKISRNHDFEKSFLCRIFLKILNFCDRCIM